MNNFKDSESDLEGLTLGAEPEVSEVDWSLIKSRLEFSVDSLGVHEVREHYFSGIWAYEDQMGGCPGHVARDIIQPLVDKIISERF